MALAATVTPLPELASAITAVTKADAPNVAIDDLLHVRGPLLSQLSP
jgi:hypothetical protein